MKKIIILGAYPSNKYSEEVLVECIDIFSNSGYDIMLTSHLPIPTYIQEKVNYFIYDSLNAVFIICYCYEQVKNYNCNSSQI
jgi:hypothetical protein